MQINLAVFKSSALRLQPFLDYSGDFVGRFKKRRQENQLRRGKQPLCHRGSRAGAFLCRRRQGRKNKNEVLPRNARSGAPVMGAKMTGLTGRSIGLGGLLITGGNQLSTPSSSWQWSEGWSSWRGKAGGTTERKTRVQTRFLQINSINELAKGRSVRLNRVCVTKLTTEKTNIPGTIACRAFGTLSQGKHGSHDYFFWKLRTIFFADPD